MATNLVTSLADLLDRTQRKQIYNAVSALTAILAPDKDPMSGITRGQSEASVVGEITNMLFGLACFSVRIPSQLVHFLHVAATKKNLFFRCKHSQGHWSFSFLVKGSEQTKVTLNRAPCNVDLQRRTRYVQTQFVEVFKTDTSISSGLLAILWPGLAAEYRPSYIEREVPLPVHKAAYTLTPSQDGIAASSYILGNAWVSSTHKNKVAVTESYVYSTKHVSVRKQVLSAAISIYDNANSAYTSNTTGKELVELYRERKFRLDSHQLSRQEELRHDSTLSGLYSSSLTLRNPYYHFAFTVVPSAYDFPVICDRVNPLNFRPVKIQHTSLQINRFDTFDNVRIYLCSLRDTMERGSENATPQPRGSLASTRNNSGTETAYEYGRYPQAHHTREPVITQATLETIVPDGNAMEAAVLRMTNSRPKRPESAEETGKRSSGDRGNRGKDMDLHTSELIGVNLPRKRPKSTEIKRNSRPSSKKAQQGEEARSTDVAHNNNFKLSRPDTLVQTPVLGTHPSQHNRSSMNKHHCVYTQSIQHVDRFLSFMSATAQCVANVENEQKRNVLMRAISKSVQGLLAENDVDTFELFGFDSTHANANTVQDL